MSLYFLTSDNESISVGMVVLLILVVAVTLMKVFGVR